MRQPQAFLVSDHDLQCSQPPKIADDALAEQLMTTIHGLPTMPPTAPRRDAWPMNRHHPSPRIR